MHLWQSLAAAAAALSPLQTPLESPVSGTWGPPDHFERPLAIVLWHGLGDNYNLSGMRHVAEIIQQILPEVYVHLVYVDEDPRTDERRLLFGDANSEVDVVCAQLRNVSALAGGFGAIGFSQGGLFMRALVERCNVLVLTLITFGSPHMGVQDLLLCTPEDDWVCRRRNALLKRQVWQDAVQRLVVPAQYFRDPAHYADYLAKLNFLADVNNERTELFDARAKERVERLQRLVLVKFDQDTTVVPKESAWFQESSGEGIVPMRETRLYRENLIGLKTLDRLGRIDYYSVDDAHMRFLDAFLVDLVSRYFGNGL